MLVFVLKSEAELSTAVNDDVVLGTIQVAAKWKFNL